MFSYWEKTEYLNEKDVIIIGSGIVGLQAAYVYKKQHPEADVLVLERGLLPGGASTRNAGFACFGSVTELMDDIEKHGEDAAFSLVEDRFKGLLELRDSLGDKSIDFSMCGGFEIFDNEEIFEKAAEQAEHYNSILKDITGEEKVYDFGTCNGFPAIRNQLEGYAHSGKLVKTLQLRAQQAGVMIWNNCPVTKVSKNSVEIGNTLILRAKNVVAATNAFTSELIESVRIEPARGYVFVTSEIDHNWEGTFHFDEGFIYFRDLGKRILIGGARNIDIETERTTAHQINNQIKEYLISFTDSVLKLPSDWEIEHEWTGIMGFGETKRPLVTQAENGVFIAAGLGGMGVALGMQTGRQVVELIDKSE